MPKPELPMQRKTKELKEQKAKGNNPCLYDKDLAEWICEITASNPLGMNKLYDKFREEGFPSPDTLVKWRLRYPEFKDMYVEAKKAQIELYWDEMIDIADDKLRDTIMNDKGETPNPTAVSRARLQIDVRQTHAAKLIPHIYGDKTFNESTIKISSHEDSVKELLKHFEE